jgi:hypothetical protein
MKTEIGETGVVLRYAPVVTEARLNFARSYGGDVVLEPGDMVLIVVFPGIVTPSNKRIQPTAPAGLKSKRISKLARG